MTKYDIVNILNSKYGFRRFLEVSTPTTGLTFGHLATDQLDHAHRVLYNCQDYRDDGQSTLCRTAQPLSHELLRVVGHAAEGKRPYDCIFLDPFHTYQSTAIDLAGAFAMLEDGGAIVMHDCNPTNENIVGSQFKRGAWCGITYAAYIDFVFGRPDRYHYTVDCDEGCGVIFKKPAAASPAVDSDDLDRLGFQWTIVREDEGTRYPFFDTHRRKLLNLISVEEFLDREGL